MRASSQSKPNKVFFLWFFFHKRDVLLSVILITREPKVCTVLSLFRQKLCLKVVESEDVYLSLILISWLIYNVHFLLDSSHSFYISPRHVPQPTCILYTMLWKTTRLWTSGFLIEAGRLQVLRTIWTRDYRETNPDSGQSGIRTRERWIASLMRWPLDHAPSYERIRIIF